MTADQRPQTTDFQICRLWSDLNLMNLIIDPNPQNDQHSLNGALASRLAKALGGETKTIRIYDANQGYFNYQFEQNWIDLILESSNLIFPVPMWNYSIPASLKDFVDKTTKITRDLEEFESSQNIKNMVAVPVYSGKKDFRTNRRNFGHSQA